MNAVDPGVTDFARDLLRSHVDKYKKMEHISSVYPQNTGPEGYELKYTRIGFQVQDLPLSVLTTQLFVTGTNLPNFLAHLSRSL